VEQADMVEQQDLTVATVPCRVVEVVAEEVVLGVEELRVMCV